MLSRQELGGLGLFQQMEEQSVGEELQSSLCPLRYFNGESFKHGMLFRNAVRMGWGPAWTGA